MIALVPRVPLRTILIPRPAALLRDRPLALDFLRRTLEAPQLLPQHLDIARVRGALALRFFHQFEHLVHLFERLAQRRDHFHHFVDGLANRIRRSGLKGTRRGRRHVPRRRALVPRGRRGRFAGLASLTRGLVRHLHLRGRRKKGFVSTLNRFPRRLLRNFLRRRPIDSSLRGNFLRCVIRPVIRPFSRRLSRGGGVAGQGGAWSPGAATATAASTGATAAGWRGGTVRRRRGGCWIWI